MESRLTFTQLAESISIVPGHNQFKLLETVVLRLLDRYFRDSGADGIVYERGAFDATVVSGIDDLPGPSCVEILFSRSRKDEFRRRERLTFLVHEAVRKNFRSLLIINVVLSEQAVGSTQVFRERVEEISDDLKNPLSVQVWGNDRIDSIFEEHFEVVSDLLPDIAKEGAAKLIKKAARDDWRSERLVMIRNVAQDFHDRGIFLFLGAGCSADAGIPGWSELVNSLLLRLLNKLAIFEKPVSDEDKQKLVEALNVIETSPLLLTRKIRDGLGDTFEDDIRQVLYNAKTEASILQSELLRELARLCVHRPPGTVGVITYNFDDLLEIHLDNIGLPFQTICDERTTISNDVLPIYHVHGFIPLKDEWLEKAENSVLVFSEEGYHRLLNNPYFWANIIQLNCLRERTCLFVGLSLTDPSLRRILDAVSDSIVGVPRHYILLKRLSTQEFVEEASRKNYGVVLDKDQSESVLQVYHELQQDTLQKLGMNIIWYEEYADVPKILEAMKTLDFRFEGANRLGANAN